LPLGPATAQDGTPITPEKSYDYASQTMRVGVWLEGKAEGEIYRKGEELAVGFQTNEDAYGVVYRIDTEGGVTILWPRSRYDDGFVFGGQEYILPVSGARRMTASSVTGEGFVEAIVSRYPFDLRNLEVDFQHEFQAENLDFRVAGDPFLAMNEVNFAITGLEDATDYVVTNYVSYYVHEEVDHPRYLCNQCHFEDEVAYDPYQDTCTLDIQVDYGYGNEWYSTYGYYPAYSNPVYVYVDPWSYRPWINFWYDPWYYCPPISHYNWGYSCYAWCDSPYYGGSCNGRYPSGSGSYRSLYRPAVTRPSRTSTEEYAGVTRAISRTGVDDKDREAIRTRTSVSSRGDARVDARGSGIAVSGDSRAVGGDKPMTGVRPDFKTTKETGSRGGLRIRDTRQVEGTQTRGTTSRRHTVREPVDSRRTGTSRGVDMVPVSRTRGSGASDRPSTVGNSRPAPGGTSADKPRTQGSDRKIKPVEPRKKGTRVWNSGRVPQTGDRGTTTQGRTNTTGRRDNSGTVRPRTPTRSSGTRDQVKPRTRTNNSSSSQGTKPQTQNRAKSSNSGSKAKSSGGSRSSGSSSSKSGSRSSGGGSKSRGSGGRG